jgi:hypothetical protein
LISSYTRAVTDGPERDAPKDPREQGAARAVLRRRRSDLSRAIVDALDEARRTDRSHDCTIEVRGGGLRRMLPAKRLAGWSLGTVQIGTSGAANFALGSDGRLYSNASPSEPSGVDPGGRFATTGPFAARRLSADQDALDELIELLQGQRPPAEPA